MTRFAPLTLSILLLAAGAQAATVSFTFTGDQRRRHHIGTSASVSGPCTLTLGGGTPDKGTFSASGSLTSNLNGSNLTVPFTLTFSDGTVTGNMTFPVSALTAAGSVTRVVLRSPAEPASTPAIPARPQLRLAILRARSSAI